MTESIKAKLFTVDYDAVKTKLTFIEDDSDNIYVVNLTLQSYNEAAKAFEPDPERENKVKTKVAEATGYDFFDLENHIGEEFTLFPFTFDGGNGHALWEIGSFSIPYEDDDEGKLIHGWIKSIEDKDYQISIRYEDRKTLKERDVFLKYFIFDAASKRRFRDVAKETKQKNKFRKLTGFAIGEAQELIGAAITVECKKFGQWLYGEIKEIDPDDKKVPVSIDDKDLPF